MAGPKNTRWVAIGVVRRAHGLKGEVRVQAYNEESELLSGIEEVVLRDAAGAESRIRVVQSRSVTGAFLIRFDGVSTRETADSLRGAEVLVERDRLPEAAPGEFYHVDLVGLAVHGPDGAPVGTVARVEAGAAHDLLVVTGPRGERLIPLADVAVRHIDLEEGRVDLEGWDEYEA